MAPQDLAVCYRLVDPAATLAALDRSMGRAAGAMSCCTKVSHSF